MNLLYNIGFKVISDTFFSKFVYMFNRVFIRIQNKFVFIFFIALILAVLITFVYYKYISRLLKIEELKILNLLKKVFRPLFRKKTKALGHDIFTKRQLKKKEERKKRLDIFGDKGTKKEKIVSTKEVKKEEPVEKIEGIEEDGYIMWPPKPKEKEEVFDKLSKLK